MEASVSAVADIQNYAVAFLMTIALETVVAWLLGYRRKLEIACVVAVNVFTHPAANFLVWLAAQQSRPFGLGEILLLEAVIVAVEWRLTCFALPRRSQTGLLFLSLAMNGVSYLAGFWIPWR